MPELRHEPYDIRPVVCRNRREPVYIPLVSDQAPHVGGGDREIDQLVRDAMAGMPSAVLLRREIVQRAIGWGEEATGRNANERVFTGIASAAAAPVIEILEALREQLRHSGIEDFDVPESWPSASCENLNHHLRPPHGWRCIDCGSTWWSTSGEPSPAGQHVEAFLFRLTAALTGVEGGW